MRTKQIIISLTLAGIVAIGATGFRLLVAPTQGSYIKDQVQINVNNASQQALDTVNGILCIISKTNYSDFSNKGAYLAQVDQNSCGMGGSDASQPALMQIVVDSTRENTSSPQLAKVWVRDSGQGGKQMLIEGKLSISASPTTLNPYGVFSFNYIGYEVGSDGQPILANQLMKGYISTSIANNGQAVLNYYELEKNSQTPRQFTFVNLGSESGYGKLSSDYNGTPITGNMAFNANYLANDFDGVGSNPAICYDRAQFTNNVYQYGLYRENGERLNHDSGFPIIYNGQQGWLGYYGLSLPGNLTPSNGDPITKRDNLTGSEVAGSLIVGNGRMQVQTAANKTLAQLAGAEMNLFPANGGPTAVVYWDSTTQQFMQTGTQNCDQNGCQTTQMTPTPVNLANYTNLGNMLNLSINGLGQGSFTQLPVSPAPTNTTPLIVWTSKIEKPNASANLALYCYNQCPVSDGNDNFNYANPAWDGSGGANQYLIYSFHPDITTSGGYMLYDYNNQAIQSSLTTPMVYVGMMTSVPVNPQTIFSGGVGTTYQWNSGQDQWNKFITFKSNTGIISDFQEPLSLAYTNSAGQQKFVEYQSFGSLQGIPGICFSMVTGLETQCGQNSSWQPAYFIPTGSVLSEVADSSKIYYVKQLAIGQTPNVISDPTQGALCQTELSNLLTNSASMTLPDANQWVAPSIGNEPVTDGKIKVINGVNQI